MGHFLKIIVNCSPDVHRIRMLFTLNWKTAPCVPFCRARMSSKLASDDLYLLQLEKQHYCDGQRVSVIGLPPPPCGLCSHLEQGGSGVSLCDASPLFIPLIEFYLPFPSSSLPA